MRGRSEKLELMSFLKITPPDPVAAPEPPPAAVPPPKPVGGDLYNPAHWEDAYRHAQVFDPPKLLIQLQDDLSRSRLREALWMSIIAHILLAIGLWYSAFFARLLPHRHDLTTADWMKPRDTTFIELPSDEQRLTKRPETNKISDKDRVATHSSPLDQNELKRIIEASRRGQQAPQSPPPPPETAQNTPGPQPPSTPKEDRPVDPPMQIAQVKPPPEGPKVLFGGTVSASTAVEQAARAAAANRNTGYGGESDTGFSQGRQGGAASNLDILSDTMGVDFGPYLARVLHDVRLNWYNLIPESARAPIFKQGKVSIQFAILKDGRVSAMQLAGSSSDVALDRAAWGGINGSNPFPPLPSDFKGEYLALRFNFYYNPPNGVGIQ